MFDKNICFDLGAEDNMSMQNHEFRCKVCKQLFPTSGDVIAHAVKDHPAYSNDVDHIFEEVKGSKHPIRMLMDQDGAPSMVPRPATMIEQLKGGQVPNRKLVIDDTELEAEAPLDLSRPSRPSSETSKPAPLGPPTPSIYSNMPQLKMHGKIPMMPTTNPTDLLSNNFGILPYILPGTGTPNAGPPGVVQPIPTNNLLKTAGAPPGFPFPFPFPFLPNQINPQALAANFMSFMPNLDSLPAELKEQMKQRLQNNSAPIVGAGGGATGNPDLSSFMHQEFLRKQTELKEQKEAAEALQHLSKVQQAPPKSVTASAAASPVSVGGGAASVGSASTENKQVDNGNNGGLKSDSDSNYKMVIKNGVLMKKQKQRRYRTERPYNCQFCEARFTLR